MLVSAVIAYPAPSFVKVERVSAISESASLSIIRDSRRKPQIVTQIRDNEDSDSFRYVGSQDVVTCARSDTYRQVLCGLTFLNARFIGRLFS